MTPLKRAPHTASGVPPSAGPGVGLFLRSLVPARLLSAFTPSVAPALPAPLCSAICSHHIGIITWGREGLAFCEVGEMGRCWNHLQYSNCAGLAGQTYPGLGSPVI